MADTKASRTLRAKAALSYARDAADRMQLIRRGQEGAGEMRLLEIVQSAVLLAKFEFAERGDQVMMKTRAKQAIQWVSMSSIHNSISCSDHLLLGADIPRVMVLLSGRLWK